MTTKCKEKCIRIRNALIGILVLLSMACFFAGCEKELAPETVPDGIIRIAVMEPLSGSESEAAKAEQQGIALANRLRSYALGKKIELVYVDNKSTLEGAEAAAGEAVRKGCIAAMGSYGNMLTLAAADTLEQAEIPLVNVTGTNPLLSEASSYIFRAASVETDQAKSIASYLISQNNMSVAALVPYSDDYATSLTDELEAVLGYEVPVVTYLPGTTDFSVQIDVLRSCNVASVFLPGEMEDVIPFLEQAQRKWIIFGTEKLKNAEFPELAGTYAEGVMMTGEWAPEVMYTKTSELFLEFYRMINGEKTTPTEAEAFGYEAYMLLLNAIERAGAAIGSADSVTGKDVQKALLETKDFSGVTGNLSIDTDGDFERSRTLWKVTRGAYINVKITPREETIPAGDVQ